MRPVPRSITILGTNIITKFIVFVQNKIISRVSWVGLRYFFTGTEYYLTDEDKEKAADLLKSGNYIILTWRGTHLTSYLISLAHFLLGLFRFIKSKFKGPKPKWAKVAHVGLSVYPQVGKYIKIAEFISKGGVISSFENVFNCDRAVLLRVKGWTQFDFEDCVQEALRNIERKLAYDNFFNLSDDSKMSCVELVWDALKESPRYSELKDLCRLIDEYGNLDPQMILDCEDFEICLKLGKW